MSYQNWGDKSVIAVFVLFGCKFFPKASNYDAVRLILPLGLFFTGGSSIIEKVLGGAWYGSITAIAVCDDDKNAHQQALQLIQEYQLDHPEDDCALYDFYSADELLANEEPLDLLFLDIELGGASGVELVPVMKEKFPWPHHYFYFLPHKIFYSYYPFGGIPIFDQTFGQSDIF